MSSKPKNINYDNLIYLIYIEFIENQLDPCWEIYHTPKIMTFLFRKIQSSEELLHWRHGLCKNINFEEIKRSKCSETSQKKMDKCPAVELGVPRYPPKEKNYEMIKIW